MNTLTCPGNTASAFTPVAENYSSAAEDTPVFTPVVMSLLRTPCIWVSAALIKINRLGELESNWDSYGAVPVYQQSIKYASIITNQLGHLAGMENRSPTIGASPAGMVAMSWDVGQWSLDIEIDVSGIIHFVYLDTRDESNDVEGLTRDISPIAAYLTQWS